MKNYPYIVAVERDGKDNASVRIAFNDQMTLWFDVWRDKDYGVTGDWNQYIFRTDNEDDMAIKAFQDAHNEEVGAYNYAAAIELAETVFDVCEDGACYNRGDEVNCEHNPNHAASN